jgi:outer membrane protein
MASDRGLRLKPSSFGVILSLAATCVLGGPLAAQGQPARVALILDRESSRFQSLLDATQREIREFFRPGEIELLPPQAGDGTGPGITALLNRTFRDSSISVVVTLGSISSHLLARAGSPSKPAIAGTIIDASWQGIPQKEGSSGVRNLSYIDQSYPVGRTISDFHRLIPFRKMAIILDQDLLRAIPQLRTSATRLVRGSVRAEAVVVPANNRSEQVLNALPSGVDAVYLTPLPSMSEGEYARLISGINARKLPTLSYTAQPDVRLGAPGLVRAARGLATPCSSSRRRPATDPCG